MSFQSSLPFPPIVHLENSPDPRRLLILACSGTKRPDPGNIPAIDRYNGPLWQTLRTADPDGRRAKVAFLSAHYGFREASWPIKTYDARLTPDLAQRMIAGGMGTRWPRPTSPRKPETAGMHPGSEIASMSRFGRQPFCDVALVGGHLYLDVMRAFLKEFIRMKCVVVAPHVTEINAPIGVMRRHLRQWLEGSTDSGDRT